VKKTWRSEIDSIDRELVQLISRRLGLTHQILTAKTAVGEVIEDPEREAKILKSVTTLCAPEQQRAVQNIFKAILKEGKNSFEASHSAVFFSM